MITVASSRACNLHSYIRTMIRIIHSTIDEVRTTRSLEGADDESTAKFNVQDRSTCALSLFTVLRLRLQADGNLHMGQCAHTTSQGEMLCIPIVIIVLDALQLLECIISEDWWLPNPIINRQKL